MAENLRSVLNQPSFNFMRMNFFLLRPGGFSKEEIEKEIGEIKIGIVDPEKPTAPGQLLSHYSPQTPFKVF